MDNNNGESMERPKPTEEQKMQYSSEIIRVLDKTDERYNEEIKMRRKRELILMITCLIALIYTYPVDNFNNNPSIDVEAISLSIPLKDAIGIFPTVIAAMYLIYIASAIIQSVLNANRRHMIEKLHEFQRTGEIDHNWRYNYSPYAPLGFMLLPTPLHASGMINRSIGIFFRLPVVLFVGFVFSALPFFAAIFITVKSHCLIQNAYLLVWNLICITVMLLGLLSIAFSASARKGIE